MPFVRNEMLEAWARDAMLGVSGACESLIDWLTDRPSRRLPRTYEDSSGRPRSLPLWLYRAAQSARKRLDSPRVRLDSRDGYALLHRIAWCVGIPDAPVRGWAAPSWELCRGWVSSAEEPAVWLCLWNQTPKQLLVGLPFIFRLAPELERICFIANRDNRPWLVGWRNVSAVGFQFQRWEDA